MKKKKDIKEKDFRKKHRMDWHDFLWERFLEKFSNQKSRQAISSIFSDYEKHLITKRFATLFLIGSGVGTREIGRLLWSSRATISAIKKSYFSQKSASYNSPRSFKKPAAANSKPLIKTNKDWLKDFLGDIDLWELIKNPPRPSGMGIKGDGLTR